MKRLLLVGYLALVYDLSAQNVYNQKWKESTFFYVPHSYSKKSLSEKEAVYSDETAKLAIREWPLSEKAETIESLKLSAREIAKQHDYSEDEIIAQESLTEGKSKFLGIRLTLKKKNRKAFLTTLFSPKTNKNYVILVEGSTKYFKNNTALVQKISSGLMEY